MIALGDSGTDSAWDMGLNPNVLSPSASADDLTTGNSWLPSRRHANGANVVFCDAHVEHAKQERWIEKTDHARRRWNNDHEPHPETW
jgi:prepilin-type processing-associated H-X9-DG protein